ncbi:class I SAM-dependent rRNA methyltransferase [Kallotenue papyrolyticum]|uniref:class I SAM-dependent rRNA methyltransferase n=1 Tax=Kallotenue papyrolyticum TaxID=1325125 RepID=UPI000492D8F7|nr:class I SAM-dependent rRNA methyltransferase [Kallotenue papyrolyticum]
MRIPTVHLPHQLRKRLATGHPWVYRDHLAPGLTFADGTWLRVECGGWSAYGLWDASSPIAIRIFSQERIPDAAWIAQQLAAAWALRAPLRQTATTAYRLAFGEGDGLPGITIDLYDAWAVIITYAGSVRRLLPLVVEALPQIVPLRGIVERRGRDERDGDKIRLLWGTAPPDDLIVQEHGLRFHANLRQGQKTGLFLDHRENRKFLEGWSYGRRVLNCFAYTGAFSVYAAWGGASEVVSCDVAPAAAEEARRNFALNGFNPDQFTFLVDDCFAALERFSRQGRSFDLIILDPPAFATSRRQLYAALRAYTRLNQLALGCLVPDGLLASASCTSQVAPEQFREMLAEAAQRAGRRLQIIHEAGQALDHPVPAHFPEGRYLKFVLCRARPPG